MDSTDGLTRREALKRGTMAGLGLVWVTPMVDSYVISQQTAQATSPVPEAPDTTENPEDSTGTSESTQPPTQTEETSGTEGGTQHDSEDTADIGETTEAVSENKAGSDAAETDILSDSIEAEDSNRTDQVTADGGVSTDELPFTGVAVEQLLPIAGAAVATGAAAVRLAGERKDELTQASEQDESSA